MSRRTLSSSAAKWWRCSVAGAPPQRPPGRRQAQCQAALKKCSRTSSAAPRRCTTGSSRTEAWVCSPKSALSAPAGSSTTASGPPSFRARTTAAASDASRSAGVPGASTVLSSCSQAARKPSDQRAFRTRTMPPSGAVPLRPWADTTTWVFVPSTRSRRALRRTSSSVTMAASALRSSNQPQAGEPEPGRASRRSSASSPRTCRVRCAAPLPCAHSGGALRSSIRPCPCAARCAAVNAAE
mmetsp:Transcript_30341/g.61026  ORF Transcript_30341/g.61026 Transcript_30341/m.61026 type:complete len:240 (-) Transcript_30341:499-1218(-)